GGALHGWLARPSRPEARRAAAAAHPRHAHGPPCARVRRVAHAVTESAAESLHPWQPRARRYAAASWIAHGLCCDPDGDIVDRRGGSLCRRTRSDARRKKTSGIVALRTVRARRRRERPSRARSDTATVPSDAWLTPHSGLTWSMILMPSRSP